MTAESISIKIVRAVNYQNDGSWNFPINYYPYNSIYFIRGGDGHIRVGDTQWDLLPGRAYLIPANTRFSCWCDQFIDKLYVDVNVEILPGYDVFSSLNEPRQIELGLAEIEAILSANGSASLRDTLYLKGSVTTAISRFLDEDLCVPDREKLQFQDLLHTIEQNLSAKLTVADVARTHSYNPTVLSRRFKQVFSCSLKQYMEKLLLERVKQELLVTDKSIKEIAAQYQFCDPYYLSNFFKKYVTYSPKQYRMDNGQAYPQTHMLREP